MIKRKWVRLTRHSGWIKTSTRFGPEFQYYVWHKPWKAPEIAVGACSHGTRVALWVDAGHRSCVILAPWKTDPSKRYYYKLIGR